MFLADYNPENNVSMCEILMAMPHYPFTDDGLRRLIAGTKSSSTLPDCQESKYLSSMVGHNAANVIIHTCIYYCEV